MTRQPLILTRHWTVDQRPKSSAAQEAARRSEVVTGHPPIPAAALPWLRAHLNGYPHKAGDPIAWWHQSGREWDAVLDLHRHGDDAAATELAQFLRWAEAHGSRGDSTGWTIGVTGSPAA